MEVKVPGLPVVPLELGPRAGADEQRVDLPGRLIHGARADGLEDAAQFGRDEAKLGGFLPAGLAAAGRLEHGADGRGALVALGRTITAPFALTGSEQVH